MKDLFNMTLQFIQEGFHPEDNKISENLFSMGFCMGQCGFEERFSRQHLQGGGSEVIPN